MKTKTLVLALILVVVAVAAPATYALARSNPSSSYYGVTGNIDDLDEEWWNEMRTYMEQHWAGIESEDWWDEMNEHIEEHWEELENGYYRYGRSSRYGGCHW